MDHQKAQLLTILTNSQNGFFLFLTFLLRGGGGGGGQGRLVYIAMKGECTRGIIGNQRQRIASTPQQNHDEDQEETGNVTNFTQTITHH